MGIQGVDRDDLRKGGALAPSRPTPAGRELPIVAAAKRRARRPRPSSGDQPLQVGPRARGRYSSWSATRDPTGTSSSAEIDLVVLLVNTPHLLDAPDVLGQRGARLRAGVRAADQATAATPNGARVTRTPRSTSGGARHEQPSNHRGVLADEMIEARGAGPASSGPARRCASSTSAATRRSTACCTTRHDPGRALLGARTRSWPRATSSSSPGTVLRSNEGRPMMTIHGTTLRRPRHDRRRLQPRSPTRCATATTPPPARLRRELPRRGRSPRARQARPRRRTSTGS